MIIRRINPASAAKIAGALYALVGLFGGAIFSLLSIGSAFAPQGQGPLGPMEMMFGVAAIVALPIFYGVGGFVMTLIAAALYNLIAGRLGGIEIEVDTTPRTL